MMPLDRNESYWMLTDELAEAARISSTRELSTYPEYDDMKAALAKYAGVRSENVLVTAGSVAAIEHIARVYASDGGEVVLPVPTFYCYETILESVGAKVKALTYEERDGQFIFPLEKTIKALRNNATKALFLCHPNNPLGCSLSERDISIIVAAARKSSTLIVSDEAYFEFSSGASFLPHLAALPNLVIIRTLSKAFALSGARVGYVIAAPNILREIEKVILPWTVAYPSITAALALLLRDREIQARRALLIRARTQFIEALSALAPVIVYPSETNFVLVRVPDATHTQKMFLARGIRVALGEPMSHFPKAQSLLTNTLRIAIPAPESTESFMTALQSCLNT